MGLILLIAKRQVRTRFKIWQDIKFNVLRVTYIIGFRVDSIKVLVALGTSHIKVFAKLRNLIFVCIVVRIVFIFVLLEKKKETIIRIQRDSKQVKCVGVPYVFQARQAILWVVS